MATVSLRSSAGSPMDVPVVAGGIIPPEDAEFLMANGIAGVYTPKDFDMNEIMSEIVDLVSENHRRTDKAAQPA